MGGVTLASGAAEHNDVDEGSWHGMSAKMLNSGRSATTRRAFLALGGFTLLSLHGVPARADWREEIGTFRVGLVAEPGREGTIGGLAKLKKAYTLALGMPVDFFIASDYRALIEAQANRQIEYAVYSTLAYATASLACSCASPLVAPTAANGAIGLRSVLITRSPALKDLADLAGYRVATAGPEDLTGALLPLAALARIGITPDAPFLVRAATAEDAQFLFLSGAVDALFGWIETGIATAPLPGRGTVENLLALGAPRETVRIAWTSDLLRYGPHALRNDLDPEIGLRLLPFLTGLNVSDPDIFALLEAHHGGAYATVGDDDYLTALDLVRVTQAL